MNTRVFALRRICVDIHGEQRDIIVMSLPLRMKHLALPAALLALSCAAQIPNAGFEAWIDTSGHDEPVGWISGNDYSLLFWGLTCVPGQPSHSGTYRLELTSLYAACLGTAPGIVTTGDATTGVPGFPFDQRPATLNGVWQQTTNGGQSSAGVLLTRWNTLSLHRDTIGFGALNAVGNITTWQMFSVPIAYVSALDPDTAIITLTSGIMYGTTLLVDDLSFGSSMDILLFQEPDELTLTPVPTADVLELSATRSIDHVTVLDVAGRVALEAKVMGPHARLHVAGLPSGPYVLRALSNDRPEMTRVFVKE